MALVVDTTRVYQSAPEGYNFTWELSKTLDQLTADDIKSQEAFVGFTSFAANQLAEGALGQGAPENNPNHCYMWATTGAAYRWTGWDTAHWSTPANFPSGVYMRNVLIYRPLNKGGNTSLTKALSDVRIVIDVEPDANTNIQKLAYSEGTNGPFVSCWWNNDGNTENRLIDFCYISPATIMIVNNVLYLWTYGGLYWGNSYVNNNVLDQGYSTGITNFDNTPTYHSLSMGWTMGYPVTDNILKNVVQDDIYGNGHIDNVDYNGYSGKLNLYLSASNAQKRMRIGLVDTTANSDISQMYRAFSGFRWKLNNVWYKPIIQGGIVTGYTDDMSVPSEWDNWTTAKGHNVPGGQPTPGPGPYDDDPWSGVSFSGVGLGGGGAFARCYYMTSTELANLRSWMSGINVPEGFNPMAQIIGLSQVPVALSGDAPETVQFINSSAVYDPGITSRVVDSNVSTQYSMGGPIKYSLGSVDITRRMQERGEPYLDYSCQIELYLPLIGVFSLDTQAVMGRTIEAEAILDPISGTLAAYAWVSKDGQKLPVAYGSTTISVDLPVTAQQYSVSKAALKQANAQLGTSLLSSVATLVAAAVGGGKAESNNARVSDGASSMQGARGMNSYAQASSIAASQAAISQTGNIVGDFMQWGRTIKQLQYGNNTAISGSFGGSVAQWSYPFTAYVKINRPRYEKPENYAHTQGVPCVQKKRIGDCTGFIQCIGVDVINIEGATDLERQAIQAALSSGIYAGGGGE